MKTADRLKDINEYYFSSKLREIDNLNKAGKEVINLGIGSPDLPPHPDVIRTLHEESVKPGNHAYQSYKGSPVLRNAMSAWYKRSYGVSLDADSEILPLIGSKEGIMHICMTYLNPGDEVFVPNPGYPTYSSAVKLAGGRIREYDLCEAKNWLPDFVQLAKTDLTKVRLMFVNYPHMPTGSLPTPGVFKDLIQFAKLHEILLIHDNPYSFILNDKPMSILDAAGAMDVAIELNSLSKSHNMAGWRIGMLAGAADRINEILKFKSNMDSGMFLPVQLAAAKALELGSEWYAGVNEIYKRRQESVFELLGELECGVHKEQSGMFVWAAIPSHYRDGFAMSDDILNKANVFVTPGGIFGSNGNGYIRVSLCSPREKIEQAIQRIKNRIK